MKPVIYLDYAATTPVEQAVADRMMSCLTADGIFANPASRSHKPGWQAEQQVELARGHLARLLDCDPIELVWTSGATESDNLAVQGVVRRAVRRTVDKAPVHLITSIIEHKAVIDVCRAMEEEFDNLSVTWLTPDAAGRISPDQVAAALRPETALVSIMHVNNELGSVNDIAGIGAALKSHPALFHVDAAQGAGKLPLSMRNLDVDLLSCCAHKLYGPKGIGALYVRKSARPAISAMIHGGGHENGLRSGTLPTHQIAGFGEAARIAAERMSNDIEKLERQRQLLLSLLADIDGFTVNAAIDDPSARFPGIMNMRFGRQDAETLMLALPDLAMASGSACNSASLASSFVLRGIGLSEAEAAASVRVSIGRMTTDEELQAAAEGLRNAVLRLQ